MEGVHMITLDSHSKYLMSLYIIRVETASVSFNSVHLALRNATAHSRVLNKIFTQEKNKQTSK